MWPVGLMMKDKGEVTGTARCQRLNLLLLVNYLGALTHHVVRMPIQYAHSKGNESRHNQISPSDLRAPIIR